MAYTDLHLEFECMHVLKTPSQRMHFFDPTPRAGPLIKTKVRVSAPHFCCALTAVLQQVGRYLLTSHCLGSGSFATVHLSMDSENASYKQVACKVLKKRKDQKMEKLMKEVRILTGLNHVSHSRFKVCLY